MSLAENRLRWTTAFGFMLFVMLVGCSRPPPTHDEPRSAKLSPDALQPGVPRSLARAPYGSSVAEESAEKQQSPTASDALIQAAQVQVQTLLVEGGGSVSARDPRVNARLFEIWEMLASGFSRDAVSGASAEVLAGKLLPREIAELSQSDASFLELLKSGKAFFLKNEEELYRAIQLYTTGVLAGAFAPDALSALLGQRANHVPPSRLDVIAYFAIRDGIREMRAGISDNNPTLEQLAPYASASNAVYRLLALEATARALPAGTRPPAAEGEESAAINRARATVLHCYTAESDPVIVTRLIAVLASTPSIEAREALTAIRRRHGHVGASDIAQRADEALAQLSDIDRAGSFESPR